MIFSKIAGDISEIAGDLAISEQSVKKIIIPALGSRKSYRMPVSKNDVDSVLLVESTKKE